MYKNKFLVLMALFLASCGANQTTKPTMIATSAPTDIQNGPYSVSMYGYDEAGPSANIAVLLPMSGPTKNIGNGIKTSVETAMLRKPQENIRVSFFDVSGDKSHRDLIIRDALNTNPDIIIGPLFAEDVNTLRNIKPAKTPVLSFTSDITALGNNVTTMNLIPNQSIETIVQQMQNDGAKNMLVLAPDDNSGKLMASTAVKISRAYNIPIKGLFYYTSNNSESIKDVAMRASMYKTRSAANTRAREVLSDILNRESLDSATRSNLRKQLEKLSRTETLGTLPYDAILFLGSGLDAKTIASFLRYYGVSNNDAGFYGTTLWHGSDIASDFTLAGAKYATLPPISDNFIALYNMMGGRDPDFLDAFGYDAANLSLGILYTNKDRDAYMFDPSGFIGTTGMFRIQPSGESERALRVMQLDGSGTVATIKDAPTNFSVPLYNINTSGLNTVPEQELNTRGINPGDYIKIPENLRYKSQYRTKTIGANYIADSETVTFGTPVQVYEDDGEHITNEEYESAKPETVSRKYIDSVEITE